MKRILLVLAFVASLPVLVLAAAVGWFTFVMDSESLRHQVLEQVRSHTGRELTIDGDIELDLFPGIGVRVQSLRLASRAGFGPEPIIDIPDARISLQVLPLLRGDIKLDMIRLESPVFRFGIGLDGSTSVTDIVVRLQRLMEREFSDGQALGIGFAMLAAQGLEVRHGEFQWFDARTGRTVQITEVELGAQRLSHREVGSLRFSGKLDTGAGDDIVDVNLVADVIADFETLETDMTEVRLVLEQAPTRMVFAVERIAARHLSGSPEIAASAATVTMAHNDQVYELVAPSIHYSDMDAVLIADSLSLQGVGVMAGGSLQLTGPDGLPRLTLMIRGSRLDLDSLLANSTEFGDAGMAVFLFAPIELLRHVAGEIDIEIGEVTAAGVQFRDFGMLLESDTEAVRVEQVRAGVSDGVLMADGYLDKYVPHALSVKLEILDADARELLGRLDLAGLVEGKTSLKLELASHGDGLESFLENLSGAANITMVDGVAHGVDIARILRAARESDAVDVAAQAVTELPKTRFSRMTATVSIKQGIGDNRDLHLVAPEFHVNGGGRLDLVEGLIDYRVQIRIVKPVAGSGAEAGISFEPVVVPFRIHGAVSAPSLSIDMDRLFKDET